MKVYFRQIFRQRVRQENDPKLHGLARGHYNKYSLGDRDFKLKPTYLHKSLFFILLFKQTNGHDVTEFIYLHLHYADLIGIMGARTETRTGREETARLFTRADKAQTHAQAYYHTRECPGTFGPTHSPRDRLPITKRWLPRVLLCRPKAALLHVVFTGIAIIHSFGLVL